jgi:DNA-binding NtrC family response regulator
VRRILIVDDDPSIVDKLARLLGGKYEVAVASNGFEALKRLNADGCDLILLDLRMPGLDGAGLVNDLRAHGFEMPIIIMSAGANLAAQAAALGVANYLAKPFDIEQLEEMIARLVGDETSGGRVDKS